MWVATPSRERPREPCGWRTAQGQSPVAVASGELPWSKFSPDGRTIYVKRYEEARIALSWIDATASPPIERILSIEP